MQTLPKVIPINELKNTAKISQLCRESDVPIVVTRNGYGEMVLMSVALYERSMAQTRGAPAAEPPAAPPPPAESTGRGSVSASAEPREDEIALLSEIFGD